MSEEILFGDEIDRANFEEVANTRTKVLKTTTDALTPVVFLLIVSPTLIGTCFI
jgi:hypothetical protein